MIDKAFISKAVRIDFPEDKDKAIEDAVKILAPEVKLPADALLQAVHSREKVMSTAIGNGVILPHAKIKGLKKFVFSIFRSKAPMNIDSPDKIPVRIMVLLFSPDNKMKEHISIMAEITRRLKFNRVRQAIIDAKTSKAVAAAFQSAE